MTKCIFEYRINKKGAECYRTFNTDDALTKFKMLKAKNDKIYTMQTRSCQVNKYGVRLTSLTGEELWSCWH